ncbi:MAG: alanine racemase [Planctomycetes bacterium]|nr:alanine racemase [Planctomycetota bacterium]
MDLTTIPTPALVLDLSRLQANANFMAARARALGVDLRPHVKTAKCAEVARIATEGHSGGITVSTLREGEYFFEHGFRDITYAVGIAPRKLERAFALIDRGADLTLLTDSLAVASAIRDAVARRAVTRPVKVLIEIDCGDGRGGLPPGSSEIVALADILGGTGCLVGVLTHAGHSYFGKGPDHIAEIAEAERLAAVESALVLRDAGHEITRVSVGSTPTATFARNLDGVTEMRPGVYLFGDLDQAELSTLPPERIAVTVLATVIGSYDNRVVVDAGGLALSKDRGAGRHGYGVVTDIDGCELPGATVAIANQEHGIVHGVARNRLNVGDRVRIVPNHICMTAGAHPGYYVVDGSRRVAARWPRVNGWEAW